MPPMNCAGMKVTLPASFQETECQRESGIIR
jgi:hypothetical protein